MNDNKLFLAVCGLAVTVLIGGGVLLYQGRPDVTVNLAGDEPVSVNVAGDEPNTFTVDGKPVTLNVEGGQPVVVSGDANDEGLFGITDTGEVTYLTSLDLSKEFETHGTSTFDGSVVGVSKDHTVFFANSTTTACSLQFNTTGTRVISGITIVDRGVASSTGTISWNVGTSTRADIITGPSSVSTTITRASGVDIITPTSTMNTAAANSLMATFGYYQVRKGEYLVAKSSTTSNQGRCIFTEL